jgi:hypothetical protein
MTCCVSLLELLVIIGVMHNFLFSQSATWWPNHESNPAQFRKETTSTHTQYIPQVPKQNINLFSRAEKSTKSKTRMICCVSLLVEPTINIWRRYDHYWWSNAQFSAFTKRLLVAKQWIKSPPISKGNKLCPHTITYLKYQSKSSVCSRVIGVMLFNRLPTTPAEIGNLRTRFHLKTWLINLVIYDDHKTPSGSDDYTADNMPTVQLFSIGVCRFMHCILARHLVMWTCNRNEVKQSTEKTTRSGIRFANQ